MDNGTAYIVCGLGFGDEGKGTITDFLAREHGCRTVVRYNGGPQAGHNVVTPDGRHHCFAQFGAATFVDGTETFLSRDMVIEPETLVVEAEALASKGIRDPFKRVIISPDCAIATPMHKMISQMTEISRGKNPKGTCGMGVGQAIFDRENGTGLTVREILDGTAGTTKLRLLIEEKFHEAERLLREFPSDEMRERHAYFVERCHADTLQTRYHEILKQSGVTVDAFDTYLLQALAEQRSVIFEGAQGALLDQRYGFTPHITKSRSTFHNATALIDDGLKGILPRPPIEKIGVIRAYGHRHGAGPFVTENESLRPFLDDQYNATNRWQGAFRVGWLDLVALRYGIRINDGVDSLAVTGLDRLSSLDEIRVCTAYYYDGDRVLLNYGEVGGEVEWEPLLNGGTIITDIAIPHVMDMGRAVLTKILFRCKPAIWKSFPGWQRDISGVKTKEGLPREAREFLSFLEGNHGLATPISIVSVSPRSDGKILMR
jgi:adenylosuccinate synthase